MVAREPGGPAMLSSEQRVGFAELGLVRIPRAFAVNEAAAMRDVVWRELQRRHGIDRADRTTWSPSRPSGLQAIKEHPVFAPIGGRDTRAAIDDLLGAGRWQVPRSWGFLLVSLPEPGEWTVPSRGWHIDSDPGFAGRPLFGVRVYTFLSDVAPRAGATLAVLGSHLLIERFAAARDRQRLLHEAPRDFRRDLLRSHAWLRDLTRDDVDGERGARFTGGEVVDGVSLRVAELTGEAGDVILAHPWLLHARAPHVARAPRMVRSKDLYRGDLPPGSRVFGRRIP
jgi:hypothetical protein